MNRTPRAQAAIDHARAGTFEDAVPLFAQAVLEQPRDARLLNEYGCTLARLERHENARAIFERALALDASLADAWHNLGECHIALEQPHAALDSFRHALKLDRSRSATLLALASLLLDDHQPDIALRLLDAAVRVAPYDVILLHKRGTALLDLGREQEAETSFAAAVAAAPEDAECYFALGEVREDRGDARGAAIAYRECLAREPLHAMALGRLVNLGENATDPADLRRARELFQDPSLPDDKRANLGYGLARAVDRQGDPIEAIDTAILANAARARLAPAKAGIEIAERVDRLIAAFSQDLVDRFEDKGLPSSLPIFVVGMPRSGTTLTEQIIAAHPQAVGAGERPEVARVAVTMPALLGTADRWPQCMAHLTDAVLRQSADDILAPLARIAHGAIRVVDKQPLNLFHIGLIALVLPNAKIVHCVRDPRDVLTSIFFENFAVSQRYATSFEGLAEFAFHTNRLMDHWHGIFPGRIYALDYEALTSDPEAGARALLDAVDLPWDPAVLDYHRTSSMVRTPSRWQVRQPINRGAVQRWLRYGTRLQPLIDALAARGFAFPD